ncbi:MAG: AAA family ATPase [Planctomycetes bacterium]|nr:AAA family ATPase [Planctomycetota bacterium]
MLKSLSLENFLLFEQADFAFAPGLNAVSGETGAGKSLVARALGLVLGGRGGQDAIRQGADEARITAVFHPHAGVDDSVLALADPNGDITLTRLVRRNKDGGGLAVNGKAVTAHAIRQTLAGMVDFAAQNEHMRLGDPAYQLELLDAYGRLAGAAERYLNQYRAAESLARRLKAGREERELVRLRLERAREELADIDQAAYNPAADGGLEDAIREMSNAAHIVSAAREAGTLLEAGEPGAVEAIGTAWRVLEKLAPVSPRLAEAAADIAAALDSVESALGKLSELARDVDANPERLDAMIGRSEMLRTLAKRLGIDMSELPARRDRLALEIEDLSGWAAGEDETRKRLGELLPGVAEAGLGLGKKRRDAAKRLARAVNRELAGLGMEQAGFHVEFEPLWHDEMPLDDILAAGPNGLDEVNFYLTPNPGEAPSAVAGAISGGESSRAVLAIKSALSQVHRPDLMFLDEVDAGVGARLGRELGIKLAEMSATRQIIVITHLPQIAAYAERHLKVAKAVRKGRTSATVEILADENRVKEIASMIHGSAANAVTIEQAREMLDEGVRLAGNDGADG